MRVASIAMGLSMWIGTSGRSPLCMSRRSISVICWERPTAKAGISTVPLRARVRRIGAPTWSMTGVRLCLRSP